MDKVLTLSVAAYNVSSTIKECLDSCLAIESVDQLEIIVVDDGATDNTAEIVQHYVNQYPTVVRFVHKENGGYGSTVNTSINLAQGKYFKLLDGDDWLDSLAFDILIKRLAEIDVDIHIAPFVERSESICNVIDQANAHAEGINAFGDNTVPEHLSMHSICYRTKLVHESGLVLPEHRLYTDTLYNVIPLQLVKTAYVSHQPIYQYRLGRDGQSVSRESLEAHYCDMRVLVLELFDLYEKLPDKDSLSARVLFNWLVSDATWVTRIMCGMVPRNSVKDDLYELIDTIRLDDNVFRECTTSSKVFRLLVNAPRLFYIPASLVYRVKRNITGN